MKCPHCGKSITRKQAAKALGSAKSERKAQSSAENGKLGGRPKLTAAQRQTQILDEAIRLFARKD